MQEDVDINYLPILGYLLRTYLCIVVYAPCCIPLKHWLYYCSSDEFSYRDHFLHRLLANVIGQPLINHVSLPSSQELFEQKLKVARPHSQVIPIDLPLCCTGNSIGVGASASTYNFTTAVSMYGIGRPILTR